MKFIILIFSLIFGLNNINGSEQQNNYAVNKKKLELLTYEYSKKINLRYSGVTYPELDQEIKELVDLINHFKHNIYNNLNYYDEEFYECLRSKEEKESRIAFFNILRCIHAEKIRLGLTKTNNYEQQDKKQIKLTLLNKIIDDDNTQYTSTKLNTLRKVLKNLEHEIDDIYKNNINN